MNTSHQNKFLRIFSAIIIILTFLSIYGWSIVHIATGGKKFGPFTKPLKAFVTFPGTVIKVLNSDEIKGIPPTCIEKSRQMKELNHLTYDLFALASFFNNEKNIWDIKLFNLRNDSVIHTWNFIKEKFTDSTKPFNSIEINNCIFLPDSSIIMFIDDSKDLYRLDKNSDIIWHNTSEYFHHSINLDSDSNLWICTHKPRGFIVDTRGFFNKRRTNESYFSDDFITKINIETGDLMFSKSISDILIENGYKNLVYGFTNQTNELEVSDPIHLNDIQPVLKDGTYWKKNDLFISLRHRSVIIHYRPSTNRIIHILSGPFLNQHDVDIISENEISIFNNNTTDIGFPEFPQKTLSIKLNGKNDNHFGKIKLKCHLKKRFLKKIAPNLRTSLLN